MTTNKDRAQAVEFAQNSNEAYWNVVGPEVRRYHDAYRQKLWRDPRDQHGNVTEKKNDLRIEVPDALTYVQGLNGLLFSRNPQITATPIIPNYGERDSVEAANNAFLSLGRKEWRYANTMSLLSGVSFIRLAPASSNWGPTRIRPIAMRGPDVLVDRGVSRFKDSRFWGIQYWEPIGVASKRLKKKFSEDKARDQEGYVPFGVGGESVSNQIAAGYFTRATRPKGHGMVKIIEYWDVTNRELVIYSEHSAGDPVLMVSRAPIRTMDDRMLVPIIPILYDPDVERPNRGYSVVRSIFDQVREKAALRSRMATAVRKDARQIVTRKGKADDEFREGYASGEDGRALEFNGSKQDMWVLPVAPVVYNHDNHARAIEGDIQGAILAPQMRGQTTGATATEVGIVVQYAQSSLGERALVRDESIESACEVYTRMLRLDLTANREMPVLMHGKKPVVVTARSLDGSFTYRATDRGETPVSRSVRRTNFAQMLPLMSQLVNEGTPFSLASLGVIVNEYDFDTELLEAAQQTVQARAEQPPSQEPTVTGAQGTRAPGNDGGEPPAPNPN